MARRFYRATGPAQKTRVNFEIRLSPVRLINENNEQVGVVDTQDAQRMAQDAGLDLVEIGADQRPPLCKIMDYGKYKYELSKKQQRSRAASKQAEMKEVRLGRSAKIDDHDVSIRVNQARRFLMDGHKVLLVQQFRGREMAHRDIGMVRLKGICDDLADIAKVEVPPKQMGRRMSLILAPDKTKIEAIKRKQNAAKKKDEPPKSEAAPTAENGAQVEAPPAPEDAQVEAPVETEKVESSADS
ncbi:MAG: translation initiation factor IF-3 [Phycisphaerales bacterium]